MNPKIKKLLDSLEIGITGIYANYARGHLTDSEVIQQLRQLSIDEKIDNVINDSPSTSYRRLFP